MLKKSSLLTTALALTLGLAADRAEAVIYTFSGSACLPEVGAATSQAAAGFGGYAQNGNPLVCPITGIETDSQDITSFLVTVTDNSTTANFSCNLKIFTSSGAAYTSSNVGNVGTGTTSIALANPVNSGNIVNNIRAYNIRCATPVGGYIRGYNVAQLSP